MRHKFLTFSTLTLFLSSLSACHGILDDIYDDPSNDVTLKEGQLYVDASSWTEWYYIDLLDTNKEWVSMSIPTEELPTLRPQPSTLSPQPGIYTYWYDVFGAGLSNHEFQIFTPTAEQPEPEKWHIAVHRNNVCTNGGAAYETSYTSMSELPESSEAFADATFTPDTWNELDVWTIREQMLQGFVGNQGIQVNPVLSS